MTMKYKLSLDKAPNIFVSNPLLMIDVDCYLIYQCIRQDGAEFFTTDTVKRLTLAYESMMFFSKMEHYEKCRVIKQIIDLYKLVYLTNDNDFDLTKELYEQARKGGIL